MGDDLPDFARPVLRVQPRARISRITRRQPAAPPAAAAPADPVKNTSKDDEGDKENAPQDGGGLASTALAEALTAEPSLEDLYAADPFSFTPALLQAPPKLLSPPKLVSTAAQVPPTPHHGATPTRASATPTALPVRRTAIAAVPSAGPRGMTPTAFSRGVTPTALARGSTPSSILQALTPTGLPIPLATPPPPQSLSSQVPLSAALFPMSATSIPIPSRIPDPARGFGTPAPLPPPPPFSRAPSVDISPSIERGSTPRRTESGLTALQTASAVSAAVAATAITVAPPGSQPEPTKIPAPGRKRTKATRSNNAEPRVVPKRTRRSASVVSSNSAASSISRTANEIKRVEPENTSMSDLCRDLPLGEFSQREQQMQKIDWVEVKRKRMKAEKDMIERLKRKKAGLPEVEEEPEPAADGETAEEVVSGDEKGEEDGEDGEKTKPVKTKPLPKIKRTAGQTTTKIINGEIVLMNDTGFETVDRHAEADAEVAQLEEVEEDDITLFFNRASLINQRRRDPADRVSFRGNDRWSDEQHAAFFAGLRMVGTDFNLLSQMIRGKNRRQVKAKFIREERIDPEAVKTALISQGEPIDFEKYQRAAGMTDSDFTDPRALQLELDGLRATHEMEMARDRAERLRKPALADVPPPVPKKRTRAAVAGMYGDGEEIVEDFHD